MIKEALDTLGNKIDRNQQKDAIHLAVLPLEAGESLQPGEHVGIKKNGKATSKCKTLIGIVDPFLEESIEKGDWVWIVIYPRTIESLRHEWVHPDIPETEPCDEEFSVAKSEKWLRDFIESSELPDYHTVISEAINNNNDGYLLFRGQDAHGEIPSEFWHHIETVTGERIYHRPEHFSCSC